MSKKIICNPYDFIKMFFDEDAPEGWVRKKLPHKVPAWNKGLKKEVM